MRPMRRTAKHWEHNQLNRRTGSQEEQERGGRRQADGKRGAAALWKITPVSLSCSSWLLGFLLMIWCLRLR